MEFHNTCAHHSHLIIFSYLLVVHTLLISVPMNCYSVYTTINLLHERTETKIWTKIETQ